MSLYYDAASVLSSGAGQGSLKSRVYGLTDINSKPAQIFALISETAKRNLFLKEVIDAAQLLDNEPKLSPLLALLLCHDHLFAKGGIAASQKHVLRQTIERHKGRLRSEFTRARLRRRCPTLEALKASLDTEAKRQSQHHPRWVRVNTLRVQDVHHAARKILRTEEKGTLEEVLRGDAEAIAYCHDVHVPDLLAVSQDANLTKSDAYKCGEIVLQDKASCFPAYLLLGAQRTEEVGDIIDGCAAPGNKTTHLAAILQKLKPDSKVIACERDAVRSATLQAMVTKAGASKVVQVLKKQDFLTLDPTAETLENVTHLLLDPSCSGSGILGREDIPRFSLPKTPRSNMRLPGDASSQKDGSRKRKRDEEAVSFSKHADINCVLPPDEEETTSEVSTERLQKLCNLQTRIVEHAMSFPAATRITYSTCSLYEQENEVVVSRLLASEVARNRGWKLLQRAQQVEGMKLWKHRGIQSGEHAENLLDDVDLDACIRCHPEDQEGTMGFFVCAFVRGTSPNPLPRGSKVQPQAPPPSANTGGPDTESDRDEWSGFD